MTSRSSLQEFDSPADRIRLHLQADKAKVIVVEGVHDASLLKELLTNRSIFPVGSRSSVFEVAAQLLTASVTEFVAVFDLDFEGVPDSAELIDYLFPYLSRDLESMLIELGGLHHLLQFKGSAPKIQSLGGLDPLVARLRESVVPVTRLRLMNAQMGWGLRFDGVDLQEKIDASTLHLSIRAYCTALRSASASPPPLGSIISIAEDSTINPGDARGKDVMAAAGQALRRLAATMPKAACASSLLGQDLLAGSALILKESAWFLELQTRLN